MESDSVILFLLRRFPGLDDDEPSRLSDLTPTRRVKRVCRDLEISQLLERRTGYEGRIGSYLLGSAP